MYGKIGSIVICFLLCILSIPAGISSSYISDDLESDFNLGSYDMTFFNTSSDAVEITMGNSTGNYTSRIFDADYNTSWESISWQEEASYNEEIVPDDGLVGLWHMNETSWNGTTGEVKDSSGSGNNGTSHGAITSTGKFSRAGDFTKSTTDYVSIPSDDSINMTDNLTVEFWIKFTKLSGWWKAYVSKGDISSNTMNYFVGKAISNKLIFGFVDNESSFLSFESSYIMATNVWFHVGITYKWTGSNASVDIYINGTSYYHNTSVLTKMSTNADNLELGRERSAPGDANMTIDELAIWNRALSQKELYHHYIRGELDLKFQVRSSTDNITWGDFLGPDQTTETYYNHSELMSIDNGQWFQYKAFFSSSKISLTPRLYNVSIEYDAISGRISGTVYDNSTHEKLYPVKIILWNSTDLVIYTYITDEQGTFIFENLPQGFYNITAIEHGGYINYTNYSIEVVCGETTSADIFISLELIEPIPINLYKGWNIIGFIGSDIDALNFTYRNENISNIVILNSTSKLYIEYISGSSPSCYNFKLVTGMGMYIYSRNDTMLVMPIK